MQCENLTVKLMLAQYDTIIAKFNELKALLPFLINPKPASASRLSLQLNHPA